MTEREALIVAIDTLEAEARTWETKAGICRDAAQALRERFGLSGLGPIERVSPPAAAPLMVARAGGPPLTEPDLDEARRPAPVDVAAPPPPVAPADQAAPVTAAPDGPTADDAAGTHTCTTCRRRFAPTAGSSGRYCSRKCYIEARVVKRQRMAAILEVIQRQAPIQLQRLASCLPEFATGNRQLLSNALNELRVAGMVKPSPGGWVMVSREPAAEPAPPRGPAQDPADAVTLSLPPAPTATGTAAATLTARRGQLAFHLIQRVFADGRTRHVADILLAVTDKFGPVALEELDSVVRDLIAEGECELVRRPDGNHYRKPAAVNATLLEAVKKCLMAEAFSVFGDHSFERLVSTAQGVVRGAQPGVVQRALDALVREQQITVRTVGRPSGSERRYMKRVVPA